MTNSHCTPQLIEQEIWLPVPGYEEYYSVSNYGRLRRDKRVGRHPANRIQNPEVDRSGYFRVTLSKEGVGKRFLVHHLVMLAFVGQRPKELVVNHIDGNKKNNHPSNLEYVTPRENAEHARRLGLYKAPVIPYHRRARGAKAGGSKLTDEKVRDVLLRLKRGETHKSIALRYGVSRTAISMIARSEKWQHVPRP